MPKKRKPAMTKVVPVKMSDELYERLQDVAANVGEADSTIIRLVLRAGLREIVKDNYQLFKFSFEEAGEKIDAAVGGSFTRSTRLPPGATQDIDVSMRLNEHPSKPNPQEPKIMRAGPRVRTTRAGIEKTLAEKKSPKP